MSTGKRKRPAGGVLAALTSSSEVGLVGIVLLLTLVSALTLPAFRTSENISETLNNATIVIVVAMGEALVLMTRQIDLSVGTILGLAAFGTGAAVGHVPMS